MRKKIYYILLLSIIIAPLSIACQHQKCPAYMTKDEIEAMHKKSSGGKKKTKSKSRDIFGG